MTRHAQHVNYIKQEFFFKKYFKQIKCTYFINSRMPGELICTSLFWVDRPYVTLLNILIIRISNNGKSI